jgi:GDP-4-dehydro-6-deoxy-D-mannose reductase
VVRPDRQRPTDVPTMIGSAAKLRQTTGWSPAISWEQTLRDLLDDWRRRQS